MTTGRPPGDRDAPGPPAREAQAGTRAAGSGPPTTPPSAGAPPDLARLRTAVRIMDDAVEIPGIGVRIGLDPVLGLIPGAGDVAGAAISGWIVVAAARMGAPGTVVARMLGNLALDALVGAIPALGDLFDVAFKANRRNMRLLEEHVLDPEGTRRRSRTVVLGAVLGVVAVLAALVGGVGWLLASVWGMLMG